jgi:hypothetical protein
MAWQNESDQKYGKILNLKTSDITGTKEWDNSTKGHTP